jgi:hypothetical protein
MSSLFHVAGENIRAFQISGKSAEIAWCVSGKYRIQNFGKTNLREIGKSFPLIDFTKRVGPEVAAQRATKRVMR